MAKFERLPGVDIEKAFHDALKQNGIETTKAKLGSKPPKYVCIRDDDDGKVYKIPTNSSKKVKVKKIKKKKEKS